MLGAAIFVALAATGLGQESFPDQLDLFRAAAATPNVMLLVDTSASMAEPTESFADCPYFAQSFGAGRADLPKQQAALALLLGCRSAGDGLLRRWAGRANIGLMRFDGCHTSPQSMLLAPIGSSEDQLRSAALSLAPGCGTPTTKALLAAAQQVDAYLGSAGTSAACRPNHIVMLTDTAPNSPGCRIDSAHALRTDVIGIGRRSGDDDAFASPLCEGIGRYYPAGSMRDAERAFEEILTPAAARSYVQYAAPAVESEGIFSGNFVYWAAFKHSEHGMMFSTIKKSCLFPYAGDGRSLSAAVKDCWFTFDGEAKTLRLNPRAVDLFTKTSELDATVGGTGQRIREQMGAPHGPSDPVSNKPYGHRTILTWRPGRSPGGYLAADPLALTPADTFSAPSVHASVLDLLWGYAYAPHPTSVGLWPQGATIDAPLVLLKYTHACEAPTDRCYLAAGANDGMLHFFDAVTGDERSAVIPAELWGPNNIAVQPLDRIQDQSGATPRYYVDGGMRLHHEDADGNAIIDPGERAFLYFGLGRGGRAYYRMAVNPLPEGVVGTVNNPPQALMVDAHSSFSNLRETWAAPVFTSARFQASKPLQKVAIIPSGHVHSLDAPNAPFVRIAPDLSAGVSLGAFEQHECASMMIANGRSPNACGAFHHWPCKPKAGVEGGCYDSASGASVPNTYAVTVAWSSGTRSGAAYRVHFPTFSLQPGDYVRLSDEAGNTVAEYGGTGQNLLGGPPLDVSSNNAGAWVLGPSITILVVTNGVDDVAVPGLEIGLFDVVPSDGAAVLASKPTLWVLGVDACAGCVDAFDGTDPSASRFAGPPTDARQDFGVLFRVTQTCGPLGPNEVCADERSSPDLAALVCPISAEPSVYAPDGILEAIYFGDECGQIWKVSKGTDAAWGAKLLLRTNKSARKKNATVAGFRSKDYRKIFTKLDLVDSTCNGARSVGVYFATGNVQRPGAADNLANAAEVTGHRTNPSSNRNVYGVVWDSPRACREAWGAGCSGGSATLDDLFDATRTPAVDAGDRVHGLAVNGWFAEAEENEGFYRDPLVFQGVAYFESHQAHADRDACRAEAGIDRVRAVDNCTGGPVRGETTLDREVWSGRTDVGGGLMALFPKHGEPLVTLGQTGRAEPAKLPGPKKSRTMRIMNWWRKP